MKYAYLTCELLGRDLDSRLLIASHLIKRGVSCVVGQQWSMVANAANCPAGVFLFKTTNLIQGHFARQAKASGHKVVMSDEEVLAVQDEAEIRCITSPVSLGHADVFLAMDERHKRIAREIHPDVPIEVIGNARVELLRDHSEIYRDEVRRIQEAGPYILFNTSFCTTNSVWGDVTNALDVIYRVRGMDPHDEATHAFGRECVAFERANREITTGLMGWATASGRRVVVRPHPAERPETWQDLPGVEVVAKTNPIPWLMGADAMVHASSTTGLEAALLGAPCLNINPLKDCMFGKMYVTDDVNVTVRSLESAKVALQALLVNSSGVMSRANYRAPAYLPAWPTGGAEKTADAISKLAPDSPAMSRWVGLARAPTQINKFQIGGWDFAQKAGQLTDAKVRQIDDSLFLMEAA